MKPVRPNRDLTPPTVTPDGASRRSEPAQGNNRTQRRPDPNAEPIPDGEHKYVPRSPYRTGNY